MLFVCPEGCQQDIGMTRSKELHRCEPHGLVLKYAKPLVQKEASVSRYEKPSKQRKPLKRGKGFAASKAQREKVKGLSCVGCGRAASDFWSIDAAHLTHRGVGGCQTDPLCVIPLCRLGATARGCHPAFDRGELDLLPRLVDGGYFPEMAHAIEAHHLSPLTVLERLTGETWMPLESQNTRETVG